MDLIVGPFYRAGALLGRPTKRQALLVSGALLVLAFMLAATWSLAGRVDPGHDPVWSVEAAGAVGPVAISDDGAVAVAAVLAPGGPRLALHALGDAAAPSLRVPFTHPVERLFLTGDGTAALAAVHPPDPMLGGRVGVNVTERAGPALYRVRVADGAVTAVVRMPAEAFDVAASADLRVVATSHLSGAGVAVREDDRVVFEHTFREFGRAVAVSRDGAFAAMGSRAGELLVRDLVAARSYEASLGPFEVASLAFSADGSRLAVGLRGVADREGAVALFEAYADPLVEAWMRAEERPVVGVAMDDRGARVVARTEGARPTLRMLPSADPDAGWSVVLEEPLAAALLSRDGSTLALAHPFHGVEVRRALDGQRQWTFNQDRNESRLETTALALSPDGAHLASNGRRAGDGEAVRLLVFDRDREGGLFGERWAKVAVAGVAEALVMGAVLVALERRRARRERVREERRAG